MWKFYLIFFFRPIPLKNFPGHFSAMSCDENRGFIEEYEVQKHSLYIQYVL